MHIKGLAMRFQKHLTSSPLVSVTTNNFGWLDLRPLKHELEDITERRGAVTRVDDTCGQP